eukprot:CAMPEP_0179944104 /NCGR_PEP_ID=MMETSP0983-20121128/18770_1 /TAXON_ID=483367 /ORGANISM="non described non described, Strain CCMP 2436" /LENGTH=36 /DNA_ID= /DNA_START= /DNA_END= /DNA_ORIENTATION=
MVSCDLLKSLEKNEGVSMEAEFGHVGARAISVCRTP